MLFLIGWVSWKWFDDDAICFYLLSHMIFLETSPEMMLKIVFSVCYCKNKQEIIF